MKCYSALGFLLTKKYEGCRLSAYQDSVGVWTIGYGHTSGVTKGMTCTQDQADKWLMEDIQFATDTVNNSVCVSITQGQFDAMVDFVFNLGAGAFKKSTLLKLVNEGKLEEASNEFPKWSHAGGKVLPGLLSRRLAEKGEFDK